MVAGDREHRRSESAQEGRGTLVLAASATVCEVTAHDDELRPDRRNEVGERPLDRRLLVRPDMQIGKVENTRWHGRCRL